MFSPCAQAPKLEEADLFHLCASLNAPVLSIGSLPAGPVRAAIVLHAEQGPGGSRVPQLSIGLRSLDSGRVAIYQYAGEVKKLGSAPAALDTALSFAEKMGFLFDDDLIGGKAGPGRVQALKLWQKLVGQKDVLWDSDPDISSVVQMADLEPGAAELLLGEVDPYESVPRAETLPNELLDDFPDDPPDDLSDDLRDDLPAPAPQVRRRSDRRSDQPRRAQEAGAEDSRNSLSSGTLGRVPLVRMRVKPDGADDESGEWLRVLASF